jgi:hypothetical protein
VARTRTPGAIENVAVVTAKACATPGSIVAVLLLDVASVDTGANGAAVTTTSVGNRGSIVMLLIVTASSLPTPRPGFRRA